LWGIDTLAIVGFYVTGIRYPGIPRRQTSGIPDHG
jgi:hypothetical protein